MADNDALTRPVRSMCEAALDEAVRALRELRDHGIHYPNANARAFVNGAIAALDRISTLRKEAGE